jgi:hypothetical protein
MKQTLADIAIILGQSPELSLVVKTTIAMALGLAAVRFARAARASVRHLVLTSTFAALLALPVAMLIVPAIAIELPWASTRSNDSSSAATAAANRVTGGGTAALGANPHAAVSDGRSAAFSKDTRAATPENGAGFVIWLTAVGRATGLLPRAHDTTAERAPPR